MPCVNIFIFFNIINIVKFLHVQFYNSSHVPHYYSSFLNPVPSSPGPIPFLPTLRLYFSFHGPLLLRPWSLYSTTLPPLSPSLCRGPRHWSSGSVNSIYTLRLADGIADAAQAVDAGQSIT